jgi:hypothetical protein
VQEITIELAFLALLYGFLGVIRAVDGKVGTCKIEIASYLRFQKLASWFLLKALSHCPSWA